MYTYEVDMPINLVLYLQVPLVIFGDSAYQSLPWVMKPYPETATTTAEQNCYNYRARMMVENAFDRLKDWQLNLINTKSLS